jgi:hypothetical protein
MSSKFVPSTLVWCLGMSLTPVRAAAPPASDQRSVVVVESDAEGRIAPKRYWADHAGNAIRRSNLDGSGLEDVVGGVSGPYGLAFDSRARLFVWTNSADEVVQAASPDGFAPTVLQSSFEDSFAIVSKNDQTETAYAVLDGQVVKLTVDRRTGAEQQEVLLALGAADSVYGLALAPDGSALYLGDPVGQMSRRLRLADRVVENISFTGGPPPVPDPDSDPTAAGQEPRQ